jgi:hypothetical protein
LILAGEGNIVLATALWRMEENMDRDFIQMCPLLVLSEHETSRALNGDLHVVAQLKSWCGPGESLAA